MAAQYQPVASHTNSDTTANFSDSSFSIEDDENMRNSSMHPFELETSKEEEQDGIMMGKQQYDDPMLTWDNPWHLSVSVFLLLRIPVIASVTHVTVSLTGKLWPTTPLLLYLLLDILAVRFLLLQGTCDRWRIRIFTSFMSFLNIVIMGFVFPMVAGVLIDVFFTEPDGTVCVEWSNYFTIISTIRVVGRLTSAVQLVVGLVVLSSRLYGCFRRVPCFFPFRHNLHRMFKGLLLLGAIVVTPLLVFALYSLVIHVDPTWTGTEHYQTELCNSMDETECALPFPSFHHMTPDPSSATGWRVNLRGDVLPTLRGRVHVDLAFLNRLDGFSTMAPLLFYMDGLKEAHEAGVHQLKGLRSISESVHKDSATLLVDVELQELVFHSASVDYLDPIRPVIMVFPARPLVHGRHYAVAVVNATDANGQRLKATPGLQEVFTEENKSDRRLRFDTQVVPALERAAPWILLKNDPSLLQLLFDFVTISEQSQLGPVRSVRDGTLRQIKDWDWDEHVRSIRIVEGDCTKDVLARTVHAEIDVPWFLKQVGVGSRHSTLDAEAVRTQTASKVGSAKFLVNIPCSLRARALERPDSKPVRAIVEFGHGLFFHRQEASDRFLRDVAHEQGYVIMAMDWRGMSLFDLLVVVKVLLAESSLFEAIRDNLIQGYACKFALQTFARNGMLTKDWFSFSGPKGKSDVPIDVFANQPHPISAFYGISQGGILGAGYTALSGVTGLVDRACLGVPGTPFALILTRSLDFVFMYDVLLMMNFATNRHIRMFLSVVQMGWDSTEGSGILAPPLTEPYPSTLLQAGLGDVIVPAMCAESLARAYNATIVKSNPKDVFGLHRSDNSGVQTRSQATLTELLYSKQYSGLPVDNTIPDEDNLIHLCVREDRKLISQLATFINSGHVVDACSEDECHRLNDTCSFP